MFFPAISRGAMQQLKSRGLERGMTLVELMITMVVMAVGLGGVMVMISTAISSNHRNKMDTTSTGVAQAVLEQVLAQPANVSTTLTISDCNPAGPTNWTVATAGAASPGNGATINTGTGGIDYSQAYSAVPVNYKMLYVACGAAGQQATFDVRWNVTTITAFTRLVTVSARQLQGGSTAGGLHFAPPVTLRSIGGV
ncbi:MAG TPA: prepilin-type N-terminal cleavage/methylation domain-containing protein [Terriglobales bacterium]|nr:prepilin-type N-terminal cleavage/methylation domain-containing protein [Terriglobales bacterium]